MFAMYCGVWELREGCGESRKSPCSQLSYIAKSVQCQEIAEKQKDEWNISGNEEEN